MAVEDRIASRLQEARREADQIIEQARTQVADAEQNLERECAAALLARQEQVRSWCDAQLAAIRVEADRQVRRYAAVPSGTIDAVAARLFDEVLGAAGGDT